MNPTSTSVFHFGSAERYLVGTLHYTPRLRRRSAAVLLCNPMGEEAARAHRLYRVLATQLERAGYAAQRFDYVGTGDSAGSDEDATVASFRDDIELAAAELSRRSGVDRLALRRLDTSQDSLVDYPDIPGLPPNGSVTEFSLSADCSVGISSSTAPERSCSSSMMRTTLRRIL